MVFFSHMQQSNCSSIDFDFYCLDELGSLGSRAFRIVSLVMRVLDVDPSSVIMIE
jgi:hypothetical protein